MSDPDERARFRLFTVAEANAVIPVVADAIQVLQRISSGLSTTISALEDLSPAQRANGHHVDALALEARLAALQAEGVTALQILAETGVQLKDVAHGIVDFPAIRGDRVVLLCWQLGEPEIGYWHELETGFAGRLPVDELLA